MQLPELEEARGGTHITHILAAKPGMVALLVPAQGFWQRLMAEMAGIFIRAPACLPVRGGVPRLSLNLFIFRSRILTNFVPLQSAAKGGMSAVGWEMVAMAVKLSLRGLKKSQTISLYT